MNEIGFKGWLIDNGVKPKIASDTISRLKRVEREIDLCDIDEQYRRDQCEFLMSLFVNMGINDNMKEYPNTSLPIGKYYMSTYRHSLKKYVQFCKETLK